MVRILVTPERLYDLSRQMAQSATELRNTEHQLGRALGGLDWEVRHQADVEGRVDAARRQALTLAEQAESLARFLSERATAFEKADAESAQSLGAITQPYICSIPVSTHAPTPVPTPAPTPSPASSKGPSLPSWENVVKSLDDLLKPIDWVSDSRQASRRFDKVFEESGRLLNHLTGRRGHIKMMTQLGNFLKDTTKGASFLSNILDVRDMNRYFSGQMTNAQIAEVALKALVPIPVVNERFARWAVANMPDPQGHWRGLVPSVE